MYSWLAEDEAFRAAVSAAEEEALSHVVRRLCGLADAAVGALAGVLNNRKATPAELTRAANVVLTNLLRIRELKTVEERLQALEEQIHHANDFTN